MNQETHEALLNEDARRLWRYAERRFQLGGKAPDAWPTVREAARGLRFTQDQVVQLVDDNAAAMHLTGIQCRGCSAGRPDGGDIPARLALLEVGKNGNETF